MQNQENTTEDTTIKETHRTHSSPAIMGEQEDQVAESRKLSESEQVVTTKPNPNGFFAETKSEKACSVGVAVRVRPLIGRELVVHEQI